jgi:fumarate reductase subunit D
MTKRRAEPVLWLLFSAGGLVVAVFVPVLVLLFGLAFPLGWLAPPEHAHLLALARHPLTVVFLFGLCVLALFHFAHRFRYTLYDGLQLKRLARPIAVACYASAVLGSLAAALVLWRLP